MKQTIEEFILQLRFNSSVVYILLSGIRIHVPSIQQALSLVNLTRKLKLRPQLSISDHYPKDYSPEIHNDDLRIHGFQACQIGPLRALKIINDCLTLQDSIESFLLEELPFQVWSQTLVFSFQFIREMKAARNVSMCHILPKTIRINACSQKCKLSSILYYPQQKLPLQLQYQTLCHTLQSMEKSKAICTLSIRHLLSIHSQKCKPSCISVVVSPIQQKLPFQIRYIQQQTLCHTLQSIQTSKVIRNLSMRHLLCTKI